MRQNFMADLCSIDTPSIGLVGARPAVALVCSGQLSKCRWLRSDHDSDCATGICFLFVCAPPAPAGVPCTRDAECAVAVRSPSPLSSRITICINQCSASDSFVPLAHGPRHHH